MYKTRPLWFLFLTVTFSLLSNLSSYAHEIRPAYLEITEKQSNRIQVLWKQPSIGDFSIKITPQLSNIPLVESSSKNLYTETYFVKEWNIPISQNSLQHLTITIVGLKNTITDVLVRISYKDGNTITKLIHPIDPPLTIDRPTKIEIPVWEYLQLGIFHIWSGFDHLLFVFGLILLVKGRKKLIWTITSFTIAHSITLALATLGIIHISSVPVEACIALSILFVGVELIHDLEGRPGLASKFPWMVAFTFGLLHGLGFAGALSQVGLPEKAIPMALFLFNVGVEMGQLAFVFVILSLIWLFRNYLKKLPSWVRLIPAYSVGSLAAFWFFERILTVFIR
jgi:hydrogenase/urease accessory protein HupE